MISLSHLLENPQLYRQNLSDCFKDPNLVDQIQKIYEIWKESQKKLDLVRQQKN